MTCIAPLNVPQEFPFHHVSNDNYDLINAGRDPLGCQHAAPMKQPQPLMGLPQSVPPDLLAQSLWGGEPDLH